MSDHDDERLKAELAAMSLSRPGMGVEKVLRRAAAEQRSRRALVRMAMAAAAVWLVAMVVGVAVDHGVTAVGQGPVSSLVSASAEGGKEPAMGWLVWQRRFAQGLTLEDLGTEVETPRAAPPEGNGGKTPDRQGMGKQRWQDQVERRAGRRAYV